MWKLKVPYMKTHLRGNFSWFVNNIHYVGKLLQFVHNHLFKCSNYEAVVKHSQLAKIHKNCKNFPSNIACSHGSQHKNYWCNNVP